MQTTRVIIPIFFLISALLLPKSFAADVPHTVLEGHTDSVYHVTFSPDGSMLASKSIDGTIKIWNPHTRQLLRTINTGGSGSIAFSPDGNMLASGGGTDKVVNLWNPKTGELLKSFKGHTGNVYYVTFSPDAKVLASGCSDGTIRFWNPETGKLLRILHPKKLDTITFSTDGDIVANGGAQDANVKVWNPDTGKLLNILEPNVNDVLNVAFSPKGYTLASAGWGGIDLWDANTGELLRSFPRDDKFYLAVAFSPDGNTLACGKDVEGISLWDVKNGLLLKDLRVNREDVYDVEFSPDGRTLASASNDNTVRLWEITPPEQVEPPQLPDFLTDENLKIWTEKFNAGHLNSWKKRELQRERVTWQVKNNQLHVQTKPWCNGRLNVRDQLAEQTNYTLRFIALPINAEQIQVKLSIVSTNNANVGIFLGKDTQDELIHPFECAYQFADHTIGSPEKSLRTPGTPVPRIGFNINEIHAIFDRGHFYLLANDQYIIDFKTDTETNNLQTIDLLGIAVFPKNCLQVANVVVDDFIISGPSIPDAGTLNVRAEGKVAILWGKLKQN